MHGSSFPASPRSRVSASSRTSQSLLRCYPLAARHSLFDCADHEEGLLRQVVVFAVHDLAKALDRVFQLDVFTFESSERSGYEEGLGEKLLNLAGPGDDELIFI